MALFCLLAVGAVAVACADDMADVLAQLRQQNAQLAEQLQKQNAAIEALNRKVASLEEKSSTDSKEGPATGSANALSAKVHLSGEGSMGFFKSGSEGAYPNSEFRVNEARLFLDASIWKDAYAYLELNLATPEGGDLYFNLGEAYLDFENVSQLWNRENMLSVRLGRMDVPFGEEYLTRDAIDNPLVSNSLMDFWGIDEGIELYGALGKVNYVFAVQNGGNSTTRDFNSDKSITLRVGGDPTKWLHVSGSAMRTGSLVAAEYSEMWIANAVFGSIGSTNTTKYNVDLLQGDVHVRLPHGHLHFSGGYAHYNDNDPGANNQRDFWFGSAEAVQNITPKFYAAARYSQIWVADGYPLVGQGDFGQYFFGPMTDNLWRLSLGLGYRLSENLVLKTEYSIERGELVNGQTRNEEDLFSAVAAFKF